MAGLAAQNAAGPAKRGQFDETVAAYWRYFWINCYEELLRNGTVTGGWPWLIRFEQKGTNQISELKKIQSKCRSLSRF
jgi:hypothetical protein